MRDHDEEIRTLYRDLQLISSEIEKLARYFSEDIDFRLGKYSLSKKDCLRDALTEAFAKEQQKNTAKKTYLTIQDEDKTKLDNEILLNIWKKKKGKFLEILCFLAKLKTFESIEPSQKLVDLNKPTVPIAVQTRGEKLFLWYLASTKYTTSHLIAKPDIVITNSPNFINGDTTVGIIECKFRERFSIPEIRQELGKAIDLNLDLATKEYTIVTYQPSQEALKIGAKFLRLTLIEFGLWSGDRLKYLSGDKELGKDLIRGFENASSQKLLNYKL